MPKGYWIPQIDVSNPEGYKAYMAATPPAHEKYHGVALVRGGKMEVVEGRARTRCVLREFPDYATALTCYRSAEYQRARPSAANKKGYWLVQVDVPDAEAYKPYLAANQAPFGEFGARYLVRGGKCEVMEGKARSRIVVLEFPSYDAALACYHSPGYRAAKEIRAGKAEADVVIVEGYDGAKF